MFARRNSVRMDFLFRLNVRMENVEHFWRTFQVIRYIHNTYSYTYLPLAEVSREESRSALVDLILEYELFVIVAFLGPNLERVVNFMERYVAENISYGKQITRRLRNVTKLSFLFIQ